jgi:hypothetical protein
MGKQGEVAAMKQQVRDRLFKALMGKISPEDQLELAEIVSEDVDALEPVIDDLLEQAFARGKFEAYLEQASDWAGVT